MGADLYIKSISDKQCEKWNPAFLAACGLRDILKERAGKTHAMPQFRKKYKPGAINAALTKLIDSIPTDEIAGITGMIHELKGGLGNFRTFDVDQGKKAQEVVSFIYDTMYSKGYFRDSYNSFSVMAMLDLSWWNDVVPMLDSEGFLPIAQAEKLIGMIKAAKLTKVTMKDRSDEGRIVDDGENSPDVWNKYFAEQRDKLIKFLKLSITMKEPIRCSL